MIILPAEKRFSWQVKPIVLSCLVLLNSCIFIFYQSDDGIKSENAVKAYLQANLLQAEYPIYLDYLASAAIQPAKQRYIEQLYQQQATRQLSYVIAMDLEFNNYLQLHAAEHIAEAELQHWQQARDGVNSQLQQLSSIQYGLIPQQLSLLQLISSQFLHGSFLHLFGNMVFLIICGFVVEAAIGHLRFLGFYLLAGIGAGLLHSASNLSSAVPLIGASGAISGVMAMYLVVFGLKKIQFFYWLYFFVGYFRAPALVLLPLYIALELFQYVSQSESQIAFLAHVGGFLTGGLLMLIYRQLRPLAINQDYLDHDEQSIAPQQLARDKVLNNLNHFKLMQTVEAIDAYRIDYADDFEMLLLQYRLCHAINTSASQAKALVLAKELLSDKQALKFEINAIAEIVVQQQTELAKLLQPIQQCQLANALCQRDDPTLAEQIFLSLSAAAPEAKQLAEKICILARKLSLKFERLNHPQKAKHYNNWADQHSLPVAQG